MPLTFQVRAESGEVLVQAFDVQNRLISAIGRVYREDRARHDAWAFLRYVDPYGDTIANHLQQQRLMAELDERLRDAETDSVSVIQTVRGMTVYGHERIHTYLWFVGD